MSPNLFVKYFTAIDASKVHHMTIEDAIEFIGGVATVRHHSEQRFNLNGQSVTIEACKSLVTGPYVGVYIDNENGFCVHGSVEEVVMLLPRIIQERS